MPSTLEQIFNKIMAELQTEEHMVESEVLAVLRKYVMDHTTVPPKDRPALIVMINEELKTKFTLNKIRRANPSQLKKTIAKTALPKSKFTGVSVMSNKEIKLCNGEDFDVKGNQLWVMGFGKLSPQERLDLYNDFARDIEVIDEYDKYQKAFSGQRIEVVFYSFLENNSLWEAFKEYVARTPINKMDNWTSRSEAEPVSTWRQTNKPTNKPVQEQTMHTENNADASNHLNGFIAQLASASFTDAQKRKELYDIFLGIYPQHRMAINTAGMTEPNADKVFYEYLVANKEAMIQFTGVLYPDRNKNNDTAANGEEVNKMCKWVAAGAAVITAGIESARTGTVTIGSVIGTLAGAGAAYYAQDILSDRFEESYLKYGNAAAFGVVMGLGGVTAGRLAESKIAGWLQEKSDTPDTPVVVPTLTLPSFSTPVESTGGESIQGFKLQF